MENERPIITLMVNGAPVEFLCDAGTCRVTIRENVF